MTDDERDDEARAFALPGSRLRYGPDKVVDVMHIDLELRPDLEAEALHGICTTTVRALDEPVGRLVLDAVDMQVAWVRRDGTDQPFTAAARTLEIRFEPAIAAGEEAVFAIEYRVVKPRHGLFFVKPDPQHPHKVAHCWTQSQDENARYWFPCLDYPHEKQTTSATIDVPRGLFALSNGELESRRDEGERTIFRYRQDVPHATYLMTMVAGPFEEVQQHGARVPVAYYVLPGRRADGERSFGKTPQMMRVFEERIGTPYPYARYGQIAVSDFIFGGMENTAATTQTDRTLHDATAALDFSSDPLVSHELAHQWFGDLLTCRDWSHAWLNEGFATFFEAVFREADLGYDEYLYDIFGCVARYLDEDADRYRRPIVCNRFRDPIELFDRHLYEKGGAVLHMLRGELGEARFWRAIRRYVAENAQRNVETIDLIRAIEAATGRNLRGFFDQWVFRGGHPKLKVAYAYDAQRKAATITIDQEQRCDDRHPPFAFEVELALAPENGAERRMSVHVERAHETFVIPVEAEPALVRFDPGAFILADVTYAFGVDRAVVSLRRDASIVGRIRAGRELAKDGSAAAREALRDALAGDAFWGVSAEVAAAIGATHAPWAREMLVRAIDHAHPKVRRAVVTALGSFRDTRAADALPAPATSDSSYFVRAAALTALGKTRDARAFDLLAAALDRPSWNGVVESGAACGLGELADEGAVDLLVAAASPEREEALRRAALAALARCTLLIDTSRPRAIDVVSRAIDDGPFLVSLSAIAAAEKMEDPRLLPTLERAARSGFDGRIRRDADEAAIRVREAQRVPSQVTAIRTDLDTLRADQKKLQDRLETLARP